LFMHPGLYCCSPLYLIPARFIIHDTQFTMARL
jgi:hypothetical protein